jgi:nicotinate-nucleotide adenylyltransferase
MRRDDEIFSPPPAVQTWLDFHVTRDKRVIHAKPSGHVLLIDTPLYSVSSTEIRDVLSGIAKPAKADVLNRSSINGWLEEDVLKYINEHQLYKS